MAVGPVGERSLGCAFIKNQTEAASTDDKPENYANVCNRYVLSVTFRHDGRLPGGVLKGWLLGVSRLISGDLSASYDRPKLVRTNQLVMFANARDVDPKDRPIFCKAIERQLIKSSLLSNYAILNVSFAFLPWTSHNRRGRLWGRGPSLQEEEDIGPIGRLDVSINMTGQMSQ